MILVLAAAGLLLLTTLTAAQNPVRALALIGIVGIGVTRPIDYFGDPHLALHAGIAPAFPVIYSSVIAAIVVIVASGVRRLRILAPFGAGWLATTWIFQFLGVENTLVNWAGFVSFASAAICYACGQRVRLLLARSDGAEAIAFAAFTLVGIELAVGLLQYVGVGPTLVASDQGLLRVRGTFGHAGDLGKVIVATTALSLLTLAVSNGRRVQRLVVATIGMAFVLTGLTASRSNLAALVLLLMTWALVTREGHERVMGRRFLLLGAVAILPFASTYALRFSADPDGGSRPELLRAAITQLRSDPWHGTGLNSYIQVVGAWDPRTASGLPVHNSFLLVAAEIGLPLTVALCLALIVPAARVLPQRAPHANPGRAAFLAYLVAFVFLGVTGWGMLKVTVLPFMLFALGAVSPFKNDVLSPQPVSKVGIARERRTSIS